MIDQKKWNETMPKKPTRASVAQSISPKRASSCLVALFFILVLNPVFMLVWDCGGSKIARFWLKPCSEFDLEMAK